MPEILGNASLLIIASFLIMLIFFLYHVRKVLSSMPNDGENIIDYVTQKNDDDYVSGKRVNRLRDDLENANKTKEQVQSEFRSFANQWSMYWMGYGVVLVFLVIWSGEKSERQIFHKLDKIERILLGKPKSGGLSEPNTNGKSIIE